MGGQSLLKDSVVSFFKVMIDHDFLSLLVSLTLILSFPIIIYFNACVVVRVLNFGT